MGSNKYSEQKDNDQELSEIDVANASSLLKKDLFPGEKPFSQIKVSPREQQRVSLGSFTTAKPPKGFSVGFIPDPDPAGSVVSEITSLGSASRYELVLHLANYGNKPVTVKVWRL